LCTIKGRGGPCGCGASHALVVKNEVSYNNTEGFDSRWEAGGSKWVRTTHVTVRGKYVHHNEGRSLDRYRQHPCRLWTQSGDREQWRGDLSRDQFRYRDPQEPRCKRRAFERLDRRSGKLGRSLTQRADLSLAILSSETGTVSAHTSGARFWAYGPHIVRTLMSTITSSLPAKVWSGAARTKDADALIHDPNNRFENDTYRVDAHSSRRWTWDDAERTWAEWRDHGNDVTGNIRVISC
jgi:hypothetical protein